MLSVKADMAVKIGENPKQLCFAFYNVPRALELGDNKDFGDCFKFDKCGKTYEELRKMRSFSFARQFGDNIERIRNPEKDAKKEIEAKPVRESGTVVKKNNKFVR